MILRPPTYLDALRIWRWRNHPSTRKWMGNQRRIGLIEHLRWFRQVRYPPTRTHLFMADNGRTVGMGRLDVIGGHPFVYEVGVLVDPSVRSNGYGVAIIKMLAKCAAAGKCKLIANIRADNEASIRAFEKAGFREVPQEPISGWTRMER